jgi:hypothetical protein
MGYAVDAKGFLDRSVVGERAQAGMGLAVAVRTEQNALRELSFGLRPASGDPVVGDREILGSRVQVMKLEQWFRDHDGAASAPST